MRVSRVAAVPTSQTPLRQPVSAPIKRADSAHIQRRVVAKDSKVCVVLRRPPQTRRVCDVRPSAAAAVA
jgi:hypothetical protein